MFWFLWVHVLLNCSSIFCLDDEDEDKPIMKSKRKLDDESGDEEDLSGEDDSMSGSADELSLGDSDEVLSDDEDTDHQVKDAKQVILN